MISANLMFNRLMGKARLRQLQIITSVAELGSLQKAADAVGLSQPATTHALAEIEELLGVRLFFRQTRGMVPTDEGRALIPLVRSALDAIKVGTTTVASTINSRGGVVRVGSISAGVSAIITDALPDFVDANPDIVTRVQEAEALRLPALLSEGRIDLAICREPANLALNARFQPVLEDRLIVVAGPSHPLANKGRVGIEALVDQTWAQPPSDVQTVQIFSEIWEATGDRPRLYPIDTRSIVLSFALIERRGLLDFMPRSVAHQMQRAGRVVEIDVAWPDPSLLALPPLGVLQLGNGGSPAVQKLIDFLARQWLADANPG